jgi:hypothetical protein
VVHYIAALGLGLEEVGAEAFADAIAASGLFPQLSAQQWRAAMIEAEASGANAEAFAALTRFDLAEALENAGIERLRRTREVATGLAGFGSMLVLHAVLMPDTRALMGLSQQTMRPRGIAFAIAACLQPMYSKLYNSLSELVAAGPPLLHEAGDDEHDPERYMATWRASIRELSERG